MERNFTYILFPLTTSIFSKFPVIPETLSKYFSLYVTPAAPINVYIQDNWPLESDAMHYSRQLKDFYLRNGLKVRLNKFVFNFSITDFVFNISHYM